MRIKETISADEVGKLEDILPELNTQTKKEIDMLELLERLEWCVTADFQLYTAPKCPICYGLKEDVILGGHQVRSAGHAPKCDLKKAIDELKKEAKPQK